jgi:hypothetical protein
MNVLLNRKGLFYVILLSLMLTGLLCSCNRENKTGSLTWKLKEGTLVIDGYGTMPNYGVAPWDKNKDSIIKVVLYRSVENIGDNAFNGCTNLVSIDTRSLIYNFKDRSQTLKDDENSIFIQNIGDNAFKDCKSLTNIKIYSVTDIGNSAFEGCENLEKIGVNSLSKNKINIGTLAFSNCKKLTSIDPILKKVDIVNEYTFTNCENLTNITIPENVKIISAYAFHNCSKLKTLTCNNLVPPGIEENTFDIIHKNIQVRVPENAISTYQKALFWNEFTFIKIPSLKDLSVEEKEEMEKLINTIMEALSD